MLSLKTQILALSAFHTALEQTNLSVYMKGLTSEKGRRVVR